MLLRLRTRRWKLWFESSYLIPNSKFQIYKPTDVLCIHDLHVNQLFLYLINVSCVWFIRQCFGEPFYTIIQVVQRKDTLRHMLDGDAWVIIWQSSATSKTNNSEIKFQPNTHPHP